MATPTGLTVRTASRQPVGRGAFQEVGVSLSFAVPPDCEDLPQFVAEATSQLELAFGQAWAQLDGRTAAPPGR